MALHGSTNQHYAPRIWYIRFEIISRTNHGFQLLLGTGIGAVIVAKIEFSLQPIPLPEFLSAILASIWARILVIDVTLFLPVIAVTIYCCAIWFTIRDIHKAASRLREIERNINLRAGETLLVWESVWGGAIKGWWGQSRPSDQIWYKNHTGVCSRNGNNRASRNSIKL